MLKYHPTCTITSDLDGVVRRQGRGSMNTNRDSEVLIIGAGPSGLMLANILGMYGHSATVLDVWDGLVDYPRVVGLDDKSFRTIQTGLAELVKPLTTPRHIMRLGPQAKASSSRKWTMSSTRDCRVLRTCASCSVIASRTWKKIVRVLPLVCVWQGFGGGAAIPCTVPGAGSSLM